MDRLDNQIEAIIFSGDKPVKVADIFQCLEKLGAEDLSEDKVEEVVKVILDKYKDPKYPFHVVKSGGGYQFLTKPLYHEVVSAYIHQGAKRRLTNAALETLAIIAYKQPVTKSEIEQIRGVNSEYTINKLMEKELVEISGRSEEVGRPLLYVTSRFFMDYFGINTLDELPRVKEFIQTENQIGLLPDIETPTEN